jgi:Domain of unknown function (DUF1877)
VYEEYESQKPAEIDEQVDWRQIMGARGVHFAITVEQMDDLLKAADDEELMAQIERIEEAWDRQFLVESDKAWDAIHRCLTDGSLLYESGEYPLNHVICGGRHLDAGDDYTISLVNPEQVKDVARALEPLTEDWLRQRYFALLKPDDYEFDIDEDDFQYTWSNFEDVRSLFRKAALADRAVVFTADA